MRHLIIILLAGYQKVVSPFLPRACRFYPSCSEYAREAIGKHGTLRGLRLALWRLMRCNPYHPGGYDPVPEPRGTAEGQGRPELRSTWRDLHSITETRARFWST